MKTVTMRLLLIFLDSGFYFGLECGGDSSAEPRTPDDFPPWAVETSEAQTLTVERERLMINSRWQRQDEFGWTTLPGTVRGENKLCVYTPVESGLYRMVGDVIIGRGGLTELRFSSNVLNH